MPFGTFMRSEAAGRLTERADVSHRPHPPRWRRTGRPTLGRRTSRAGSWDQLAVPDYLQAMTAAQASAVADDHWSPSHEPWSPRIPAASPPDHPEMAGRRTSTAGTGWRPICPRRVITVTGCDARPWARDHRTRLACRERAAARRASPAVRARRGGGAPVPILG